MGAATVQQMADRVAALMEERLSIRGKGLSAKLRKGGRLLPRKVREEAEFLAIAAERAQHPKLLLQMDQERLAAAYDHCVRHLGAIDTGARRRAALMGMASSIAFAIFATGLLVAGLLAWRGFL